MTRLLSKSKLLAFRQCPKRLWLEIHRRDLINDAAATQARFKVGHEVGEIARQLYDPQGQGALIDVETDGFESALERTRVLLQTDKPIFEAGFAAAGALSFADVMLPVHRNGQIHWRMVEIKSSASVKSYQRDDAAVQSFVARSAGVPLVASALAHIDSKWIYPGDGDYVGLFKEQDLTNEALARSDEVQRWIHDAQAVLKQSREPENRTGTQCSQPYVCGFIDHCNSQEPQAQHSVRWLPNVRTKTLKTFLADSGAIDLREVPDELLNAVQRRVKDHSLSEQVYFDAVAARADLAGSGLPAYFMDFETTNLPVPIWKGTRPFQQIPFQFSVHRVDLNDKLDQIAFLDLSGNDPSKDFAERLVAACGGSGPVFVYNAAFERSCLRGLAERVPLLAHALIEIEGRLVDLQVIAAQRYYHPRQKGSWSIKQLLPAVAPELHYGQLDGVKDGAMAMDSFREAIDPSTSAARKAQIERQLLDYCALDTLAMVRIWQLFTGRPMVDGWPKR